MWLEDMLEVLKICFMLQKLTCGQGTSSEAPTLSMNGFPSRPIRRWIGRPAEGELSCAQSTSTFWWLKSRLLQSLNWKEKVRPVLDMFQRCTPGQAVSVIINPLGISGRLTRPLRRVFCKNHEGQKDADQFRFPWHPFSK